MVAHQRRATVAVARIPNSPLVRGRDFTLGPSKRRNLSEPDDGAARLVVRHLLWCERSSEKLRHDWTADAHVDRSELSTV